MAVLLTKLVLFVIAQAFIAQAAFSHSGGLDSYGCHKNNKAGGYHCHRGDFAGESFASKSDMLAKLRAAQAREEEKKEQPARTEQRLTELKQLRKKDLITEEEYKAKRAEILEDL